MHINFALDDHQHGVCPRVFIITRMRGIAIRNAIEANPKVNGKCEISQPIPPKPLDQFGCRFKYITMFAQGVDVQNLIKIDSAVAARVFCGFVC